MPRRTPGEIRSQFPLRDTRHARRTVIQELSASANRQITAFERERGLPKGDVALAFQRWALRAGRPRSAEDWHYGCWDVPSGHIRTLLEVTAWNLRSRARRELRAALAPVDARILDRTANDPFAPQELPWWQRRIESEAVRFPRSRGRRRPGGHGPAARRLTPRLRGGQRLHPDDRREGRLTPAPAGRTLRDLRRSRGFAIS